MKTGCGFGLHPVFRYFFPFSVGIGFADAKPFTRGKNKKGLSAFIKSYLSQSLFLATHIHAPHRETNMAPLAGHGCYSYVTVR